MKRAIILHGTQGSPESNWFLWLKRELSERGLEVWLPALPHPEYPSLAEWLGYVRENCPFPIDEDTLVVGHSSGAILALVLAQQNNEPIGAMACVSVFHDNSLKWEANDRLFDVELDYDEIILNVNTLLFVHSDNDPYVPLDQAQFVAERCEGELIVIEGQGHFNLEQSSDYKSFPKLTDLLEERGMI